MLNKIVKSKKLATKTAADALYALCNHTQASSCSWPPRNGNAARTGRHSKRIGRSSKSLTDTKSRKLIWSKSFVELSVNETVKAELEAQKELAGIARVAAKSGSAKVVGRLKKLVENFPNTEAAESARKMLAAAGG